MEMEAVEPLDMLLGQLVDGEAQPRMRGAGVIARHLTHGMERVDAQADVEGLAPVARGLDNIGKAFALHRRVEDDVVGQAADLLHVLFLVGRAEGRDLAVVMLARQHRFPQARCAHAVQIFADHRRDRPHRKCFQCGQHLAARAVADVGQHAQVLPQLGGIDHEGGAVDEVQVEIGKGSGIAGAGFHQSVSFVSGAPMQAIHHVMPPGSRKPPR